jgi:hypothetical protein
LREDNSKALRRLDAQRMEARAGERRKRAQREGAETRAFGRTLPPRASSVSSDCNVPPLARILVPVRRVSRAAASRPAAREAPRPTIRCAGTDDRDLARRSRIEPQPPSFASAVAFAQR